MRVAKFRHSFDISILFDHCHRYGWCVLPSSFLRVCLYLCLHLHLCLFVIFAFASAISTLCITLGQLTHRLGPFAVRVSLMTQCCGCTDSSSSDSGSWASGGGGTVACAYEVGQCVLQTELRECLGSNGQSYVTPKLIPVWELTEARAWCNNRTP
jgi:hypothetical protein